jgi:ankyrin repeat protein
MTGATETLKQLLERYVRDDTYTFQDYAKLEYNTIGRELWTPLHMACNRGECASAQLLIEAGADVDALTDMGMRPLHSAVYKDSFEIVEMLLSAGADPTAITDFGEPPSILAVGRNRDRILALLERASRDRQLKS